MPRHTPKERARHRSGVSTVAKGLKGTTKGRSRGAKVSTAAKAQRERRKP